MAIKALRGSSRGIYYRDDPVPVQLRPRGTSGPEPHQIQLDFSIPAGGRGSTDLSVRIDPADFLLLAQAMMDVSPKDAIKAFGMAMITGRQSPLDDEPIG